jgi:hypothetical protein
MDNVQVNDAQVNDAQVADVEVNAAGAPSEAPDNALPEIDAATAKKMAKNDAGIAKLVALAVATLDPKDMLKKYAALGRGVIDHALWQKGNFPKWEAQDWDRLCDKLADQVKFQVAIKDVRMGLFARIYLWVEAVRPMVPDVEKLSYYQVVNFFVQTLKFSSTDLVGEIKKGWIEFVRETVAQQVSDAPLTIAALKVAIAEHTKRLEDEANAKKSPEKIMEAAHKAEVAKRTKAETDLRTKLTTGIDEALGGILSPTAVVDILNKVAADRKVDLPAGNMDKLASMSPQEAKLLASSMWKAGNISAMKVLRD